MPPILKGKILSTLVGLDKQIGEALTAIRQGLSVTLFGAPGRGKSHLAHALVLEWIVLSREKKPTEGSDRHIATWLSVPEFFFEIKQTYNPGSPQDEEDVMTRYSFVDLLVLDDLGAEKVTDWSRQLLYLLIDRRYRNQKQTIVTTNLTPQQLAEIIDARIVSRLAEMGAVIELTGSDKRVSGIADTKNHKTK